MLTCRVASQPDVVIIIGTMIDSFAGELYVGAPYVDGELMTVHRRDALGRTYEHKLPYRSAQHSADGLGRLLRKLINDVNEARDGHALSAVS